MQDHVPRTAQGGNSGAYDPPRSSDVDLEAQQTNDEPLGRLKSTSASSIQKTPQDIVFSGPLKPATILQHITSIDDELADALLA